MTQQQPPPTFGLRLLPWSLRLLAVFLIASVTGIGCEYHDDSEESEDVATVTVPASSSGSSSSRPKPTTNQPAAAPASGPVVPTTEGWTLTFGGSSYPLTVVIATGDISGTVNILGTDYALTGTRVGANWTLSINGILNGPYVLVGAEVDATHVAGTSTYNGNPGLAWTATRN